MIAPSWVERLEHSISGSVTRKTTFLQVQACPLTLGLKWHAAKKLVWHNIWRPFAENMYPLTSVASEVAKNMAGDGLDEAHMKAMSTLIAVRSNTVHRRLNILDWWCTTHIKSHSNSYINYQKLSQRGAVCFLCILRKHSIPILPFSGVS